MASTTYHPAQRKRRMVLYEELAEYYYKAVAHNRIECSDVRREVTYHLQNITLLSLYFDSVLITSATIFNVRDQFVSKVISTFLQQHRVREMLKLGALKIVGWGSTSAARMFDAASDYSGTILGIQKDPNTLALLRSIFSEESVVSRSPHTPDADLWRKYVNRLENTTFINDQVELQTVFDVVARQRDRTGSLIAIEMLPSLNEAFISESLLNESKLQLFGVTIDHMRDELPDLWVYSPFLSSRFAGELASSSQGAPRAFLLSPIIFGNFLSTKINGKTFSLVMDQSYNKLHALRNGDWGRFVQAYHQAISDISDAITLGLHISPDQLESYDSNAWAERVISRIEAGGFNLDVTIFVESLGTIGGIILGIPALKPLAKLVTMAIGEKLRKVVSKLSEGQRNQMSPFILKLEKAYLR